MLTTSERNSGVCLSVSPTTTIALPNVRGTPINWECVDSKNSLIWVDGYDHLDAYAETNTAPSLFAKVNPQQSASESLRASNRNNAYS